MITIFQICMCVLVPVHITHAIVFIALTWPQSLISMLTSIICLMVCYPSIAASLSWPDTTMAMVTEGLKWAPQQVPVAKFMHHRDAAMENPGALEPPITFKPTVKTRKCAPRNSLRHQSIPIIILAILIQKRVEVH